LRGRFHLGLRGKIVAALMVASTVTLLVAALAVLGPLERRLRTDEVEQLVAVGAASRPSFARLPAEDLNSRSPALRALMRRAGRRADARVVVLDARGHVIAGTDVDPGETFPRGRVALIANATRAGTTMAEGVHEAEVALPVAVDDRRVALVLRRSLREPAAAVGVVRRAFVSAGAIGLGVALLLGGFLATRLVRRLRRLRDTTLRVAEVGPAAELLADSSTDEVGGLTRAFATMQTRLRRQEAARRTFVSTASHELRTPLTSLVLMLDNLRHDLAAPTPDLDGAREQVSRAQEQSRRLTKLADELLELSRVDAGLPLRRELVEVGELCRAVVAEFEERLPSRAGAIEIHEDGPAWTIADPGGVARVVRILVDNALRFSPAAEPVRVSVEATAETTTVTVADRGPGVPPDDRERIFERFARGVETDGDGGFGLGLAIGRDVAGGMHGELALAPSDHGAAFVLHLPAAPPDALHERPA
jgi:signal transduction histidine kinase